MKTSLWVDRRNQVSGPGLHALIIGVSDYQFLPGSNEFPPAGSITFGLTKVNIPATGAFRVARWLKECYWHPTTKLKSIRLLLSPSKEELVQLEFPELAEASATQPRANTAEVWQALQDWQKDCAGNPGDIAVLYVAGHGIQWGSKDDAYVLLEDFSKDQLFLNQAIDVGRVLKGMSGDQMPQAQFYFVDACRIQPDEHSKFEDAGTPLRLRSQFNGEDLRSAPIYYAACPQTAAKGHRGRGTYFAEALIDCLDLYARQGPNKNSGLPITRNYWHVSVNSLLATLQDRISEVARPDGVKQDVMIGGLVRPSVFCASESPPDVTVVVHVDPESAAQVAFAELWSSNRSSQIKQRSPCWSRPLKLEKVPVGIYLLELSASPPYKGRTIAVDAQPPQWNQPIILS
jgi:hypothetical protein